MNFIKYFFRETWHKRTIYRLLFQWELLKNKHFFQGKNVLDIGAGNNPSYGRYIYHLTSNIIKTDYLAKKGVDQILDFNKKFPFADNFFDTILLCNALYIAEDARQVVKEINRVLRPGGHLVLINPFVANEMPEPHDYIRFTKEGLRQITKGLIKEIKMVPIGERGSVAMYALQPALFILPFRIFGYIIALVIDQIIPGNIIKNHPFPLGYLYVGQKETVE